MSHKIFHNVIFLLAAAWCAAGATFAAASVFESVDKNIGDSIAIEQQSQKELDDWAGKRQALTRRYKELCAKGRRLDEQVKALESEARRLEDQLAGLERENADALRLSAGLEPFLRKTMDRLGRVLARGLPFLQKERSLRQKNLEQMMDDPDVAAAEKLSGLMDALVAEAEYGSGMDVHQQSIQVDGERILAETFRLGRVSLFFLTLDESACGVFDPATHKWTWLSRAYAPDLARAAAMAAKRRPPDVVALPLGKVAVP